MALFDPEIILFREYGPECWQGGIVSTIRQTKGFSLQGLFRITVLHNPHHALISPAPAGKKKPRYEHGSRDLRSNNRTY